MISALKSLLGYLQMKRNDINYFRSIGVKIGERCRLISPKPGYGTFGSEPYLVELGNHVTVCANVQFVTHDGGVWVFRDKDPNINVYQRINVGNNVFIGYGAIIMPGVEIGNNVIIGAGSVVTRSIPENSVAVGSPAKVIKTLEEYMSSIVDKAISIQFNSDQERRAYLTGKPQ